MNYQVPRRHYQGTYMNYRGTEESQPFYTDSFSEKGIRMAFIRKVYAILMIQLAFTVAVICLFVYEPNVKKYTREHPELVMMAFVALFILTIVLFCCENVRRSFPANVICLGLYTLVNSFVLGLIASFYKAEGVVWAVGICTVVCLALTLFAFQTQIDFTLCSGVLFVCLLLLIILGIVTMFVQTKFAEAFYACFGALIFSLYLIYNTQLLMGDREYAISPEEYIFAVLSLYVDIVNLFLFILQLVAEREE